MLFDVCKLTPAQRVKLENWKPGILEDPNFTLFNLHRVCEGVFIPSVAFNPHFGIDKLFFENTFQSEFPEIGGDAYGVADDVPQILGHFVHLIEDPNRIFTISITHVRKEDQPSVGGWRWHKWGPYIGRHQTTTEYLYDEPKIEAVICFHIYELDPEKLKGLT